MINVTAVKALGGHRLQLTFSDDTSGEADLTALVVSFAPFKPLANADLFAQATVEHCAVAWPGGLDIPTERLYALAHGLPEPTTFEQAQVNERRVRP